MPFCFIIPIWWEGFSSSLVITSKRWKHIGSYFLPQNHQEIRTADLFSGFCCLFPSQYLMVYYILQYYLGRLGVPLKPKIKKSMLLHEHTKFFMWKGRAPYIFKKSSNMSLLSKKTMRLVYQHAQTAPLHGLCFHVDSCELMANFSTGFRSCLCGWLPDSRDNSFAFHVSVTA